MRRVRPSLALGLSLAVLNLCAAVLRPAAHTAEHLHDAAHHGAMAHGHHDSHDGGYSHDVDGHLHLDLQAVVASPRPDVGPLVAVAVTPLSLPPVPAAVVPALSEHHPQAPARTHDPPSAARAPPAS